MADPVSRRALTTAFDLLEAIRAAPEVSHATNFNVAVVLGHALSDSAALLPQLRGRIDRAIEVAAHNPIAQLILSSGAPRAQRS